MAEKRDNYQIQVMQAKKHFLSYDQQELIRRCGLRFDECYFYMSFLGEECRICRRTGDMERLCGGNWIDGNSFGQVMTVLDWLCDSKPDRSVTGRFVNIVTQGYNFHRNLQEIKKDPDAELFSANSESFCRACEAMGGERTTGADIAYTVELLDGVKILLKLYHPDEDFPAQLTCLWEENVLQYIRYETSWFAMGVLISRIKEYMTGRM